jgi:hypothetical protein
MLSACDLATAFNTTPPVAAARPAPDVQPAPPEPVASTLDPVLVAHYARVESDLRARGFLRTDPGGADAPFDAATLARNFERIAFFSEFDTRGGRLFARQTSSPLHRWEAPVRMSVQVGTGVPPTQAQRDRTRVASFAARLGRITGHPVRVTNDGANFHVLIVTDAERRALGPTLARLAPGVSPAVISAVTDLSRSNYCLVLALDGARTGAYTAAVAVIRAELPDLLRLSCIHEELAQGMGLANDHPLARPSIFNDDEEFALLTRHDELLLRMLYDPRLRPGMTVAQARPIFTQIAAELLGGSS